MSLLTASGEAHGLINRLANSVAWDDCKNMTPDAKEKLLKDKKADSKKVKARYINHRGRHERLDKPYCRYAGDPIEIWHLIPGYTYDLPYGFVKEVNEARMPIRSGLVSIDGQEVRQHGAPLERDEVNGDAIHELVPVSF